MKESETKAQMSGKRKKLDVEELYNDLKIGDYPNLMEDEQEERDGDDDNDDGLEGERDGRGATTAFRGGETTFNLGNVPPGGVPLADFDGPSLVVGPVALSPSMAAQLSDDGDGEGKPMLVRADVCIVRMR